MLNRSIGSLLFLHSSLDLSPGFPNPTGPVKPPPSGSGLPDRLNSNSNSNSHVQPVPTGIPVGLTGLLVGMTGFGIFFFKFKFEF